MKTGRRQDPDGLRRIPRDRDLALSRTRKRPSMLSEFHGKHYNHRELDRESGGSHYRPYYRCSQYELGSGMKRDRYGPGFFKGDSQDVRHFSSSPYARTLPQHGAQFYDDVPVEMNHSHEEEEEEVVPKRPCLLADVSSRAPRHLDPPSSADSSTSGTIPLARRVSGDATALSSSPPQGPGLSAYLEDIESDEGDLGEEEEKVKLPTEATHPSLPTQPSKEQLLQKMEKVDRDIAATEGQIAALQKKQAEVEESVRVTPSVSSPSPLHPSPITPSPSPEVAGEEEEEMSVPLSPEEERRVSPRRSLLDTVYSENRLKAKSSQAVLGHLSHLPPSSTTAPLYYQPWEAPGYLDIIERHKHLRSELIHSLRRQRLEKHEKDLALCKQYDSYMTEWRRRLDKMEGSLKKKTRDQKNRELFERTFPELKMRREQQERLMRVDQRGYGVVRSELELNQLMYELYEQEEAPARTRRTHAVIPAMVTGGSEERLQFHNTNGLITDPMAVYRAAKMANVWTDEEKKIFREKYAIYPKNFEAISSFLPCKTTADCVRYYYLSKKNEKFKQLARKATLKRRKFIKPGDLAPLPPPPSGIMGEKAKMVLSDIVPLQAPPTALMRAEALKEEPLSPKPSPKTTRYGDWTEEDISNLRMGLRRWGRAWGKIYREVGGRKTATQCKQFYDDFCNDESLGLARVLTERSSIKTAEKAQRKAESRKPTPIVIPAARKRVARLKPLTEQEQVEDGETLLEGGDTPADEGESEGNESASIFDSGSAEEDSGSESTITDSSPEDSVALPHSSTHLSSRGARARKTDGSSPSLSTQGSSENGAFDLFISAAEALNNTIPPEVALHDHNYALAPISSVELQGSSGLSLIAAAAAVVSPSLSRSAGSGKFPAMSPVRAPRGRPPNTQRRGSNSSTCKLAPTLLSPAGNSIYVPLTDTTKSSFRSRARSAPSDRPRIQLPRAGPSNLRYSISSKSSSPRPILPPASYSRLKDTSSSASGGSNARSSSLKSMMASRPQQSVSSNAAFETLVNVAVAASPAELPKSTAAAVTPTATLSISFQNPSNSAPSTPVSASSHLTDGTYSIDMSQAINILALASLAQGSPSSSTSPSQQVLLTQGVGSQASSLLGTIVSQSTAQQDGGKPATANTVNVLIGHLTSGSSSPSPSNAGTPLSESSGSSKGSPVPHPELPPSKPQQRPASSNSSLPPVSSAPSPHTSSPSHPSHPSPSTVPPLTSSAGDDLSNLNLLSSLVAVVTGSQAPPTPPTPTTLSTSRTTEPLTGYSTTSSSASSTPSAATTTVSARASAFRATNLPSVPPPTADSPVPSEKREVGMRSKVHEKSTPQPSVHNSEHSRSSSSRSGVSENTAVLDSLPRSVVRSSSSLTHHHHSHTTTNSLTTSLVSPAHPTLSSYPAPAPSISQQSTLLLYTRSLSLPNPAGAEVSSEEEDHLESATRGISELSKLLGTDSGTESLSSSSGSESSVSSSYRNSWDQNSVALPSPVRTSRSVQGTSPGYSGKTESGNDSSKPYLSGLLESHSSHLQQQNSSSPNNTNANNNYTSDLTRNGSR